MSYGNKSKKQTPVKSKLLKLKEWLAVPEAGQHLSIVFGEEVTEADVLRLALDGKLKLSVNFVNGAHARRWEKDFLSKPSQEQLPSPAADEFTHINSVKERSKETAGKEPIPETLHGNVTTIRGVWDLPMIGSERLDVEHEYMQLIGGPEVTGFFLDGAFVEGQAGEIYQLQERFDENVCQSGSTTSLMKEARATGELDLTFAGGITPHYV